MVSLVFNILYKCIPFRKCNHKVHGAGQFTALVNVTVGFPSVIRQNILDNMTSTEPEQVN